MPPMSKRPRPLWTRRPPNPLKPLAGRLPRLKALGFRAALRLYPPYLGAGIRVEEIAPDLRRVVVAMPLTRLNRNYVGTHFGGSLFAMTDPFYMLMLIQNLGPRYVVWDKRSSIRFRKPGVGTVRAVFELTQAGLEEIRRQADQDGRHDAAFHVDITDEAGQVVAEVDKVVQVRRKAGRAEDAAR